MLVAAYEVKLLEQSTGLKDGSLAKLIEVRVRDYMVVATKQEAAGRSEEALRLATVADLMARHQKLTFARGAITPGQLISRIEAAHPSVRLGTLPGTSPAPDTLLAPKDRAKLLVAEARRLFQAGKLTEAADRAEAASRLDVAWDLLEDRPRFVLQDISQKQAQLASAEHRPLHRPLHRPFHQKLNHVHCPIPCCGPRVWPVRFVAERRILVIRRLVQRRARRYWTSTTRVWHI
jgi:hypothetical protein